MVATGLMIACYTFNLQLLSNLNKQFYGPKFKVGNNRRTLQKNMTFQVKRQQIIIQNSGWLKSYNGEHVSKG